MLINCAIYQNGDKVAEIPTEDISEWLGKQDCFVWVALKDATDDELAQMKQEFSLHELAVEDARNGHQRPKMEEYGKTVFVVMHLLELSGSEPLTGEIAIFVGPNFVLSLRRSSSHSFLGVRERCEREPHLLKFGSGFVFYALMDAVVDRYFPVLDALETELELLERDIFKPGTAKSNIEKLYELKLKTTTMRHAVSPLLEVISKLHGGRVPPVCELTQDYFRDVHDHLIRINGTLESIRDIIGTGIQVNLSMVTIEESETTKKLASWAAIFGVSTSLAGIWGMNFKSMPELQWDYGYPMAIGVIVASVCFLFWRFKRAGWL